MINGLKCRKCRNIIVDPGMTILDAHNSVIQEVNNSVIIDCGGQIVTTWFIEQTELSEWMIQSINEGDWRKGKLMCPFCYVRVGTFDFISGAKCCCNKFVLPPVHFIKSKCDLICK